MGYKALDLIIIFNYMVFLPRFYILYHLGSIALVVGSEILSSYSIGYNRLVSISIIEMSDGKLLYVVKEPELDNIDKRIKERVFDYILNDVGIIKRLSTFTSFDDGYSYAKDIVQVVCKKFFKNCSIKLDNIVYYILRDFIGYGEIDPLIRDPSIEDITCDGFDKPIYIFHNRFEWLETNKILSRDELEKIVKRIAYRAGKEVNIAQPIVEGILRPEGYRVHIVLDTVSLGGHSFTIRKFKEIPYTVIELINSYMLSPEVAAFLWLASENRQGIIFYGPTGAGKTTLMNAIAMLLPPELKIVTTEDTPEIRLPFHDNWISMVTRLSVDAYVQSVTLQMQVESAMRQRPDILIVGEIRSREAYSFFQAVSTGHGGLTTIHAENVESLIRRLSSPPMNVPRSLIASARLFVQLQRFVFNRNVARKVIQIHEVEDYDPSTDNLVVKTVIIWNRYKDSWKMNLKNNKTIESIAKTQAVDYEDIIKDLFRRTIILRYASKLNLDIITFHTLVRRYRRSPEDVYRQTIQHLDKDFIIEELDIVEKKIL